MIARIRRADAFRRKPVAGAQAETGRRSRDGGAGLAPAWTSFLDRRAPSATAAGLPTSEIADCSCPAFCERDHEND